MLFGLGKSNKKRTNRRSRRTSKRRSNRRRQRGGNSDYASAYGSAPAAGGDAKEDFAGMLPESFANHGPAKGHDSKDVAGAPPAGPPAGGAPPAGAMKGGAGAPPSKGGRRRRGSKGRKSFGTGEMTAAALAIGNFYGPGAKSRRNRRKSRRNRSQRRR